MFKFKWKSKQTFKAVKVHSTQKLGTCSIRTLTQKQNTFQT